MVNIVRGDPRVRTASDVPIEAYEQAHQYIGSRRIAGGTHGHRGHPAALWLSAKNSVRREIIAATLKGTRRGGGCAAGTLGAVIFHDGRVGACELLDEPLGHLRKSGYDLQAVMQSEGARRLRDRIQDTNCLCTQECFLSVSMLMMPRCWPGIVRKRLSLGRGSPDARQR